MATRLGSLTFQVPQVRGDIDFYPSALEKGLRSERNLKLALAEMYVKGISTRKVTDVLKAMCGLEISSSQVSRAAGELDGILKQWRERPLGTIRYLILDARYDKIRQDGAVRSCAVLIAIASTIKASARCWAFPANSPKPKCIGASSSKACKIADSTPQSHPQRRHAGLKASVAARLCGVLWQRCQFHLQRNAMALAPKLDQRAEVARDLRSIFNALDRPDAEARLQTIVQKWAKTAPKLSAWLEANVPEALTVFSLPKHTGADSAPPTASNGSTRNSNEEPACATIFPSESALERLVTALLMEQSEQWETDKTYLTVEN